MQKVIIVATGCKAKQEIIRNNQQPVQNNWKIH